MIDIEIMLGTVIIIITVPTFNVFNISFYLIRHKCITQQLLLPVFDVSIMKL